MSNLRRIDINLILVLDAVLAEKNLTRAAEVVGMSQPAVSGALARLRKQLGDPILVRVGGKFELTPQAAGMHDQVRAAIAEISRTLLMPSFDPATSTRTFRVSGSDYALAYITSPLLAAIAEQAPGVRVHLDPLDIEEHDRSDDANVTALLRRDIMIVGTGRDVKVVGTDRGMPGEHAALFSDTFVCIAAAGRFDRDEVLSMEGLAAARCVRSDFGESIITHVDAAFAAAGISPDVGVTVQGFLSVPWAVSGTDLIGFVPERIARQYLAPAGLAIIPTSLPPITLVEAAFWHPSKTADPARRWLVGRLRRAAELLEFGHE